MYLKLIKATNCVVTSVEVLEVKVSVEKVLVLVCIFLY